MREYEVRTMTPADFEAVMMLERRIFGEPEDGSEGEGLLCPNYVRLCTDVFNEICFLALADGEPVGYLLSFERAREAFCTTLATTAEHRRSRALPLLIRAYIRAIAYRVDACIFTVKPENKAARAMHASLGATELGVKEDYYGPGDLRIVSRIDQAAFAKLRERYIRMGLIEPAPHLDNGLASGLQAAG